MSILALAGLAASTVAGRLAGAMLATTMGCGDDPWGAEIGGLAAAFLFVARMIFLSDPGALFATMAWEKVG